MYNELIDALRNCADEDKICTRQTNCGYYGKGFFCQDVLMRDAADAIEAAEKRIAELEADKKTLINVVKDKSDFHATKDAMRIAELEARLPKEGEWIKKDSWYYCSCCGHEMFFTGTFDEEQRFCYYCGARMRGEHDG